MEGDKANFAPAASLTYSVGFTPGYLPRAKVPPWRISVDFELAALKWGFIRLAANATTLTGKLLGSQVLNEIARAFATWGGAATLGFSRVPESAAADIRVRRSDLADE